MKLQLFLRDVRGATALVFGLALLPLFIFIGGGGMDYARRGETKVKLQHFMDGAVLAAATAKDVKEPKERLVIAKAYFDAAVNDDLHGVPHGEKDPPQNPPVKNSGRREVPKPEPDNDDHSPPYSFEEAVFELILDPAASTEVATGIKGSVNGRSHNTILNVAGIRDLPFTIQAEAALTTVTVRQLDMVFCVDATFSMVDTLEKSIGQLSNMNQSLKDHFEKRNLKPFDGARARVIFFRDFSADRGPPDEFVSPPTQVGYRTTYPAINRSNNGQFWELPAQLDQLVEFVKRESAAGGGDLPDSGLVCLDQAIKSSWAKVGDPVASSSEKKITEVYPVIFIWTDANTRPLTDPNSINLPMSVSQTHEQLKDMWNSASIIDQAKKMIVFFGNINKSGPMIEECPHSVVNGQITPVTDINGNVFCNAAGAPHWAETIGTWGLGKTVFVFPLGAGNNDFVGRFADVMQHTDNTPRLKR